MSNQINPYELIYLVHQNDEEAFDLLFQQALPLTRMTYGSFQSLISFEDWKTDAMLCLEQSINRYREDENTEFFSFYVTLLRNHGKELWRLSTRQKAIPPQALVPYEAEKKDGSVLRIEETSSWKPVLIEEDLLVKITCDQILFQLAPHLSKTEQKVLDLLRQGYPTPLIAKILQLTPRQVRRVRQKAVNLYQSFQKEKPSQISLRH